MFFCCVSDLIPTSGIRAIAGSDPNNTFMTFSLDLNVNGLTAALGVLTFDGFGSGSLDCGLHHLCGSSSVNDLRLFMDVYFMILNLYFMFKREF